MRTNICEVKNNHSLQENDCKSLNDFLNSNLTAEIHDMKFDNENKIFEIEKTKSFLSSKRTRNSEYIDIENQTIIRNINVILNNNIK